LLFEPDLDNIYDEPYLDVDLFDADHISDLVDETLSDEEEDEHELDDFLVWESENGHEVGPSLFRRSEVSVSGSPLSVESESEVDEGEREVRSDENEGEELTEEQQALVDRVAETFNQDRALILEMYNACGRDVDRLCNELMRLFGYS
jgi:hypothetical protein